MNNKGSSIQDVFLILIVIFAFVVVAIMGNVAMKAINDGLQGSDDISPGAKEMLQEKNDSLPEVIDGILLILLIGMAIALIFGATLLPTHPIFFVFVVIILAVVIGIAAGISNAYTDFNQTAEVSEVTANMVVLPFVMAHFPKIMLFLGVLLFIGLYAKSRQETGGFV